MSSDELQDSLHQSSYIPYKQVGRTYKHVNHLRNFADPQLQFTYQTSQASLSQYGNLVNI